MAQATTLDERDAAVAAAALVFAIAAPATYMLERLYEYARGQNGNPMLVLRTLHTVYYWRVGIAVWWGIALAGVAYALYRRAPGDVDRRARRLAAAAALVVPLVALAAWFYP